MTFELDAVGTAVAVTDGTGGTSRSRYDTATEEEVLTDANGGEQVYGFDTEGNWVEYRDKAGRSDTVAYDAASQPITADTRGGEQLSMAWDQGRVATVTGPDTWVEYRYDDLGRVTQVANPETTITRECGAPRAATARWKVDLPASVGRDLGHLTDEGPTFPPVLAALRACSAPRAATGANKVDLPASVGRDPGQGSRRVAPPGARPRRSRALPAAEEAEAAGRARSEPDGAPRAGAPKGSLSTSSGRRGGRGARRA